MRRAARAGDDDLEARGLRALGEGDQPVGRAMGGDDPRVVADAKRLERLGGAAHDRPIGLAAHDDGDRLRRPAHEAPPRPESTQFMGSRLKEGA